MEKLNLSDLPVLDDFSLFLNFLRSHEKVPVTGTSHFLKFADLYRLNEELHFKADWVNPRSQQRHYPALEFFYHVVITSQIARLHHDPKGSYLAVVPEKLEKYDLLTPTEKYFFLLETFWCHLNWDKLNDDYNFAFVEEVLGLLELVVTSKPGQEFEVINNQLEIPGIKKKNKLFVNGSIQKIIQVFWFLGFCELFPDNSLTKKPDPYSFSYKKISGTVLGRHLGISLLLERPLEKWSESLILSGEADFVDYNFLPGKAELHILEEAAAAEADEQQPDVPFIEAFKTMFPAGELTEPFYETEEEQIPVNGCYHLKVALDKNLYRTIAISASATLEDLHAAIQEAFDFDDDHLYSFYMSPTRWSGEGYSDPRGGFPPYADEVKLFKLDLYKGYKFNYLFDFGDSWRFSITVTKADSHQPAPGQPVVVEAKGENPEQYPDYEEED